MFRSKIYEYLFNSWQDTYWQREINKFYFQQNKGNSAVKERLGKAYKNIYFISKGIGTEVKIDLIYGQRLGDT
jgi:hypothetical protein